jgi:hypothetical protein
MFDSNIEITVNNDWFIVLIIFKLLKDVSSIFDLYGVYIRCETGVK